MAPRISGCPLQITLPLNPIIIQMNPDYILTPYFRETHSNISLPSAPLSSLFLHEFFLSIRYVPMYFTGLDRICFIVLCGEYNIPSPSLIMTKANVTLIDCCVSNILYLRSQRRSCHGFVTYFVTLSCHCVQACVDT